MSELIDRKVLLDELWKQRRNYQMMDDTHTADKIMHGLYRAEQVVKEAPTVAVPRWVRCDSFVLPKPGQLCLVYDEDGYMSVATYTGDKYFPTAYGFHVDGEEVTDITHWMPIEPPKEDA